jgi:excisionase family DNA binding protein
LSTGTRKGLDHRDGLVNRTTLLKEVKMPEIMTTRETARYLKLHEITVCKHASEGKIPSLRIGRLWRFDKEAIDKWIAKGRRD